jgi:hypothetical protein
MVLRHQIITDLQVSTSASAAAFGPDGVQLALFDSDGLSVTDVNTRSKRILIPRSDLIERYQYTGGGLAWSRDSQTLAIALKDKRLDKNTIWTVDVAAARARIVYSANGLIEGVTFGPK